MDKEHFEALCDFLRTHSAEDLDPIWVTKNMQSLAEYEIVDGEHRWKAAKEVGWRRLRAFVKDLDETSARVFNVRKNRERGRLDAYKLGKILSEEYDKGQTQNGVGQKYGLNQRTVSEYIDIYQNHEQIRDALNISAMAVLPFRKARDILRELKHPEKLEEQHEPSDIPSVDEQLKKYVKKAVETLKNNPIPEKEWSIEDKTKFIYDFVQRQTLSCPICGEKELVWRCGHNLE